MGLWSNTSTPFEFVDVCMDKDLSKTTQAVGSRVGDGQTGCVETEEERAGANGLTDKSNRER